MRLGGVSKSSAGWIATGARSGRVFVGSSRTVWPPTGEWMNPCSGGEMSPGEGWPFDIGRPGSVGRNNRSAVKISPENQIRYGPRRGTRQDGRCARPRRLIRREVLNMRSSLWEVNMISRTKVSKGYLTVVPKEVRRASQVREGDVLEWSLEGDVIVVRPRHRRTVDDIAGVISHGGDAVASKRAVQRGARDRR